MSDKVSPKNNPSDPIRMDSGQWRELGKLIESLRKEVGKGKTEKEREKDGAPMSMVACLYL